MKSLKHLPTLLKSNLSEGKGERSIAFNSKGKGPSLTSYISRILLTNKKKEKGFCILMDEISVVSGKLENS